VGEVRPDVVDVSLDGPHVRLRVIEPSDYPWIRRAEMGSPLSFRWRLAGQHVQPEHYAADFWRDVLAGFVFEHRSQAGRGIVLAHGYDPRYRFCHVSIAHLEPSGHAIPDAQCVVEAFKMLVDYAFQGWDLRKIYLECADFNVHQFESFLDRCDLEGRLIDHLFLGGRWWDLRTYAIWKERWQFLSADIK
jgi:hypothetical protein